MADVSLAELFYNARSDAMEILQRLKSSTAMQTHVGFVVCIHGHFPFPGAQRPAHRRIYDVGVLFRDLLLHAGPITVESLAAMHAIENSQLTDVAELRHQINL